MSDTYDQRHELLARIVTIQKRTERVVRLAGLLAFVGGLAVVIAILFWFEVRFRSTGRFQSIVEFGILVGCCVSLLRLVLIPAFRYRLPKVEAAKLIESQHPKLRNRLVATVAFLANDSVPFSSRVLQEQAVSELSSLVSSVEQTRTFRFGRLGILIACSMISVLGLSAWCYEQPEVSQVAAQRVFLPWQNVTWPARNELTFVNLPDLVAKSDSLDVAVKDLKNNLPSTLILETRIEGTEEVEKQTLKRQGDVAVWNFESLQQSIEIRALGGDGDTGWKRIRVVESPAVVATNWFLSPPSQLKLEPYSTSSSLIGPLGTKISGSVQFDRPVAKAQLIFESDDPVRSIPLDVDESGTIAKTNSDLEWTIESNGRFWIETEDPLGLVSRTNSPVEVQLLLNPAPTVQLTHDLYDGMITESGVIRLQVQAFDVLRLESVTLEARRKSGQVIPISLGEFNANRSGALSTADGNVVFGDTFSVVKEVRVQDIGATAGEVFELVLSAADTAGQTANPDVKQVTVVSDDKLVGSLSALEIQLAELLINAYETQRQASQRRQLLDSNFEQHAQDPFSRDRTVLIRLRDEMEGLQRRVSVLTSRQANSVRAVAAEMMLVLERNQLQSDPLWKRAKRIDRELEQLHNEVIPPLFRYLGDLEQLIESDDLNELLDEWNNADDQVRTLQNRISDSLRELSGMIEKQQDLVEILQQLVLFQRDQSQLRQLTNSARIRDVNGDVNETSFAELRQRLARQQFELDRRFDDISSAIRSLAKTPEPSATEPDQTRNNANPLPSNIAAGSGNRQLARKLDKALELLEEKSIGARILAAATRIQEAQLGLAIQQQDQVLLLTQQLIDILRNNQRNDTSFQQAELGNLREILLQVQTRQRRVATEFRQTEKTSLEESATNGKWSSREEELATEVRLLADSTSAIQYDRLVISLTNAADSLEVSRNQILSQSWDAMPQILDRIDQQIEEAIALLSDLSSDLANEQFQDELQTIVEQLRRWRETEIGILAWIEGRQNASQPLSVDSERLQTLGQVRREMAEAIRSQLSSSEGISLVLRRALMELEAVENLWRNEGEISQTVSGLRRAIELLDQLLKSLAPTPQTNSTENGDENGEQEPPSSKTEADLRTIRILQANVLQQTIELQEQELSGNTFELGERQRRLNQLASLEVELVQLIQRLLAEAKEEISNTEPDEVKPKLNLPLPGR